MCPPSVRGGTETDYFTLDSWYGKIFLPISSGHKLLSSRGPFLYFWEVGDGS